jgi:hypothetical protein
MRVSPASREVRLAPESIEALAARLAELLATPGETAASQAPGTMLSAAEVSRHWGVSRRWVYEHAEALGACRLGEGPRPRLRFDPAEVAGRLGGTPPGCVPAHPSARSAGRPAPAGGQPDMFDGSRRKAAGGRANAPGPASKKVLRRAPEPSLGGRPRSSLPTRRRGGGLS